MMNAAKIIDVTVMLLGTGAARIANTKARGWYGNRCRRATRLQGVKVKVGFNPQVRAFATRGVCVVRLPSQ